MNPKELASFLREHRSVLATSPVVTGFDGFVDEMITVVDQRDSLTHYKRINSISQFGEKITAAAGHSSLREIVINQVDPGGCAINMGDGLASLGVPITTFATVGEPVHPAFADYAEKVRLISWGEEHGRTLAYEFADGKLMFSAVSQLQKFHPDNLCAHLADGAFVAACAEAKLIAITDWTLYPHMTDCWKFLLDQVFSRLSDESNFFFDLVDPSSRSEFDVKEMLNVLERFSDHGRVTLGLNQNEANILARISGITTREATVPGTAMTQCEKLKVKLKLDAIVIHSIKYAVGCEDGELASVWPDSKIIRTRDRNDRNNARKSTRIGAA